MNKSDQINELAAALAKAQGEMKTAIRDSVNPFFKSKYADLASVVEAIRGPFAEHGLSYVQLPIPTEGDWVQVETVLMHASGQWISSIVDVPVAKGDAQGYGSALTYARRYGLSAVCGVAPEDDDGNAAAKAKPRATAEEMTPKPTAHDDYAAAAGLDVGGAIPPPARTTRFVIAKSNYATAGMTEPQMRASFDLVRLVNERYGKGKAEGLLRSEFQVVSRSDLTEEQAARYLVRLTELKEAE
jgi:ERF superfamily